MALTQSIQTFFPDTYGLVICGGKSSRMGTDKSMLQYYDKPQRYHVYDMLLPFCESAFISCNAEQSGNIAEGYDHITDDLLYNDIGPMAALLSAFALYPKKNFLLIGSDYPFLTAKELQEFSAFCIGEPAAFYNKADDIYEPLLAWYPHTCFTKLKSMYEATEFSLQHFLKDSQAIKYLPTDGNCIQSIDTPEAFKAAYKLINAG